MTITLDKRSNGIHSQITVDIWKPETKDLSLIKEILVVVEKYNKKQIELA